MIAYLFFINKKLGSFIFDGLFIAKLTIIIGNNSEPDAVGIFTYHVDRLIMASGDRHVAQLMASEYLIPIHSRIHSIEVAILK